MQLPSQHQMDQIASDRRLSSRYGLHLRLRYRVLEGLTTLWTGAGVTSDISRTGVRFEVDRPVPLDARVEVEAEWPVRLGGTLPLELWLAGTVVRCDDAGVAVQLASWRFQAASAPKICDAGRERTGRWVPPAVSRVEKEQPRLM